MASKYVPEMKPACKEGFSKIIEMRDFMAQLKCPKAQEISKNVSSVLTKLYNEHGELSWDYFPEVNKQESTQDCPENKDCPCNPCLCVDCSCEPKGDAE